MHELFNVVTGPEGHPEAVLIRGVEGAKGPGRLTKLLHITRALNRERLATSVRLWMEDDGFAPKYVRTPRIGIAYASARDRLRKWRFVSKDADEAPSSPKMKEGSDDCILRGGSPH